LRSSIERIWVHADCTTLADFELNGIPESVFQ
jgi:hypothetical protein